MFFSNFLGGETRGTKIPISLNVNNYDYQNVIKIFLLFVSIEASRQYNAILVGHTYLSRNTLVSHFEIEKNRNIVEIIFKGKDLTKKQALSL